MSLNNHGCGRKKTGDEQNDQGLEVGHVTQSEWKKEEFQNKQYSKRQ
jgi:hypothetical protein